MSDVRPVAGRPSAATRIGWAVLLTVAATATGLFWAGQRAERSVDATAGLSLEATVTEQGTVEVREEIVVGDSSRPTVTRVIADEVGVVWQGARDAAGGQAAHTTVPVAGGLAVTFPVQDGSTVIELDYTLLGATSLGRDAVELAWTVVDDRNPLALTGVELDLRWGGGEGVELLDVEAPGIAPTVVAEADGLRLSTGRVRAHHDVALHGALHRSAVPAGIEQDRSVMAEMEPSPATPQAVSGGGPWWLAVLVAATALLLWGVLLLRHARDPDVVPAGGDGGRPSPHTPAELAWLLRRGATRDLDLAATLADLVARGVVAVDEGDPPRLRLPAPPPGDLHPHEVVLLDWLFDGRVVVDTQALVGEAASDPGRWRAVRRDFVAAVEQEQALLALVPRRVGDESVLGAGVAAAVVVVGGVVGVALGQPAWIACIVAGSLALAFGETWARLSGPGAQVVADWTAYGQVLAADGLDSLPGHALVLGVREPEDSPVLAIASRAVDDVQHAFVTSTSFVAAPRRRLVRGRRSGSPAAARPRR